MDFKARFNDDKLLKNIDRLKKQFPNASRAIIVELAGESQKAIKTITVPYRTGNLASSIRVINDYSKVAVVAGGIHGAGSPSKFVDYAKFVNEGTSKQPPQRFMERGVLIALSNPDSFSKKIFDSWLSIIR